MKEQKRKRREKKKRERDRAKRRRRSLENVVSDGEDAEILNGRGRTNVNIDTASADLNDMEAREAVVGNGKPEVTEADSDSDDEPPSSVADSSNVGQNGGPRKSDYGTDSELDTEARSSVKFGKSEDDVSDKQTNKDSVRGGRSSRGVTFNNEVIMSNGDSEDQQSELYPDQLKTPRNKVSKRLGKRCSG